MRISKKVISVVLMLVLSMSAMFSMAAPVQAKQKYQQDKIYKKIKGSCNVKNKSYFADVAIIIDSDGVIECNTKNASFDLSGVLDGEGVLGMDVERIEVKKGDKVLYMIYNTSWEDKQAKKHSFTIKGKQGATFHINEDWSGYDNDDIRKYKTFDDFWKKSANHS